MPTPPSPNAALNALFTAFVVAQPSLLRHVRASFPGLCWGHAEDAVSAVGLALVMNPTTFLLVHDPQNPKKLHGLFKRVAWRAARGTTRRRSFNAELGFMHEDDVNMGYDGTQHTEVSVKRDLPRMVSTVAEDISPPKAERLGDALQDQLVNGGTDGEVAERHDVPREYVCRGRHKLTGHFVGEPRPRRTSRPPARRAQKTV